MPTEHAAFLVDAFTTQRFAGNQAAVCLIDKELKDDEYLKIGAEFNLSETAFPLPDAGDFKTASHFTLRWFTPKVEVPLCGHATLATAHVLFNEIHNENAEIGFTTRSGELRVQKVMGGGIRMNFPRYSIAAVDTSVTPRDPHPLQGVFSEFDAPDYLMELIRCIVPQEIFVDAVAYAVEAKKLLIVVDSNTTRFELESRLERASARLLEMHPSGSFVRGIAVTLHPHNAVVQGFVDNEGEPFDYVCRYFAPWVGIEEDPATGSAQCALGPFWAKLLEKESLYALQAYPGRGAQFRVSLEENDRISIVGTAVTVLSGKIFISENFY